MNIKIVVLKSGSEGQMHVLLKFWVIQKKNYYLKTKQKVS